MRGILKVKFPSGFTFPLRCVQMTGDGMVMLVETDIDSLLATVSLSSESSHLTFIFFPTEFWDLRSGS